MSSGSQVIKLNSGDTIQVRTGVIQGIGPQGPTGPTGPAGAQGDPGPQGMVGPMGNIADYSSECSVLAQSIATATNTLVNFTTVRDDLSVVSSATNFAIPVGTYQGVVNISFTKQAGNAVNSRSVQVLYNSAELNGVTVGAAPTRPSEITVPFQLKVTTGGLIMQVQVFHDEGATLAVTGRLIMSKVGPGPQGPQGPQGPAGPAGAVGATGPQGPSGTIADNTTTYAAMGG